MWLFSKIFQNKTKPLPIKKIYTRNNKKTPHTKKKQQQKATNKQKIPHHIKVIFNCFHYGYFTGPSLWSLLKWVFAVVPEDIIGPKAPLCPATCNSLYLLEPIFRFARKNIFINEPPLNFPFYPLYCCDKTKLILQTISSGNDTIVNYFITITMNILIPSKFACEKFHTASGREIRRLPGGSKSFVTTARSAKGTQPAIQDPKTTPVLLICLEVYVKRCLIRQAFSYTYQSRSVIEKYLFNLFLS